MIVCFSYQDILELTLFYIYSERNWGKSNVLLAEIWNFCNFCIQLEVNGKLWGDDIINSLICIFIRLVKNCFLKICEISKFHNFLIFQPIFIRFSLFCLENFTLSSKIKLNLFRITPLMMLIPSWFAVPSKDVPDWKWTTFVKPSVCVHSLLHTCCGRKWPKSEILFERNYCLEKMFCQHIIPI